MKHRKVNVKKKDKNKKNPPALLYIALAHYNIFLFLFVMALRALCAREDKLRFSETICNIQYVTESTYFSVYMRYKRQPETKTKNKKQNKKKKTQKTNKIKAKDKTNQTN